MNKDVIFPTKNNSSFEIIDIIGYRKKSLCVLGYDYVLYPLQASSKQMLPEVYALSSRIPGCLSNEHRFLKVVLLLKRIVLL